MPNKVNNIIKQFIEELTNILGESLKKVILYGSYARGDFDKNSDIDIMILTDLPEKEIEKIRGKVRDIACDLELENDVVISPMVKNIDKYNERINIIPFYINVKKEGIVLHG